MNNKPLKIVIAGGRFFKDYDLLSSELDTFLKDLDLTSVEVVCGMAKGADLLGKKYADIRGITVKEFPANWSMGKRAGHVRNAEMARYSTHLFAFWDGLSRGTKHMIDIAYFEGLDVKVIHYE